MSGQYATEGDRLTSAVTTNRPTTHNGITSVFGVEKVTINPHGGVSDHSILAKGTSPPAPGINFTADLSSVSY